MSELERLALQHIEQLGNQLDNELISLGNKILDKKELTPQKDTYPIAGKARDVARWAKAVLDHKKS